MASLKLSSAGKEQVERALTDKQWSVENLASKANLSVPTAKSFRAGKPIKRENFVEFCKVLGLSWEIASGQTIASPSIPIVPSETLIASPSPPSQPDDALFGQVREHCKQKILNQHSRMRLLSGEEIGVDQLYVDVWLLNRSPRTFQVSPNKLLETFDLRNDRLGLGDRIRRNPGFEVANDNAKLLILGKPGSGKTTFLKHLAVDWCKGRFQSNLIAVLIELRQIRNRQWNLIEEIDKELGLRNWHQFRELKKQIETLGQQQQQGKQIRVSQQMETLPLQYALKHGKLLVLMDGLDEVPTNELRRNVQNQLQQVAMDYPNNRLILTCRTQIIETIPAGFTSVEVADFSKEQVQEFVENWFISSGSSTTGAAQQWKIFDSTVNRNLGLEELTVTPVLLSLMCLVLQDEGEIPSQRDWLYQKGIKLLLSKWNDAKQIDGWELGSETYRQLNPDQKEALLIEIAARKFENPESFVLSEQREIVNYIDKFFRPTNLNRRMIKLLRFADFRESIAVLRAIEAQHGLLIERADELWSFSHLTFQEYFTVRWLTQLPPEQLAEKIASQQWQKIVQQIVRSQQPANRLVRLIKQAIDQSIANEPNLQKFLTWVLQKSVSIQTNYKPAAIRAFYLDFTRASILASTLDRALDLDRTFAHTHPSALETDLALDRTLIRALDRALNSDHSFDRALAFALDRALDAQLAGQLKQLRAALPVSRLKAVFEEWWQVNSSQWTEQLRQVMIEHRNIGHDWQFIDAETQQLQRYYTVNKFLVDLMKIEGAVSNNVRAEIEDSLLLPWEELQRRQS